MTPLLLAAHGGKTDEVQKLLSAGANPNERSRYGWTALMFASWKGHLDLINILLDAGADPNNLSTSVPASFETTLGHPPSTALREAIRSKHIDIANVLIKRGALIDADAIALAGGYAEDVNFLAHLKRLGAGLNATTNTNIFYATPLIAAARSRNLENVKWLVENGADPDKRAGFETALEAAVHADEPRIAQYLIEHGASPNALCNDLGETVIFYAATKHTYEKFHANNLLIIEMLLSHGADLNHRNKNNNTVLECVKKQKTASASHHNNIIELLKKYTK